MPKIPTPIPLFDQLEEIKTHFLLDTGKSGLEQLKELLPHLFHSETEQPELNPENAGAYAKDYTYACQFLHSYRGSPETFKAYRREIERLLEWCWFIHHQPLTELKRADIESFLEFCQAPPVEWIGLIHTQRFIECNSLGRRIPNLLWRPFVATVSKKLHHDGHKPNPKNYVPSQSALQAIFAILSSFFNYLQQEEYANINPVAQIRQKSKFLRKHQGKRPIRRLSELQWSYVIETAEMMAQENTEQHERTLFIMTALYAMYLRISELAASQRWTPLMEHFYKDMDGNWWFKTVGKGNKERDISVSDAMLKALKRYRQHLGLSSLPSPGENIPLIVKLSGRGAMFGTRHLRRIVQECFDQATIRLREDNFIEEADTLMTATVHWLRHTGISDDVKIRPREHVRDDAGHSSSAITDRYIDIELRERHASARKKTIRPEDAQVPETAE